jgi:hypothetical protein
MESVSTLGYGPNGKDMTIPSPFSYDGDMMSDMSLQNGIQDVYATPTDNGGDIFKRTIMNLIGMISTLDLFMSSVGAYASFVNGISYQKTAKLEFFDSNGCMQMDVMAMSNGLGNFNNDSSLIAANKWRHFAGTGWSSEYFN